MGWLSCEMLPNGCQRWSCSRPTKLFWSLSHHKDTHIVRKILKKSKLLSRRGRSQEMVREMKKITEKKDEEMIETRFRIDKVKPLNGF